MNSQNKKPLLFLGAGASVDAGLLTTQQITNHLKNFSRYSIRPTAKLIEKLFRVLQEELAYSLGVNIDYIDFETILGVLIDGSEGRNIYSKKHLLATLIESGLGDLDLDRIIQAITLYIQGLCLRTIDVEYLDVLLNAVWDNEGTIATLNYDNCIERRHSELNRPFNTGFKNHGKIWKWEGFNSGENGTELLKLHGSVGWLRQALDIEDTYSISHYMIFHSDPIMIPLYSTAKWETSERKAGVRILMNIGIAKEQLYITPPFDELFSRLRRNLHNSDIVFIVGYSFRDPAINRMLIEAIKVHRVPIIVINPSVEELLKTNPVVKALNNFGVLTSCSKATKEIQTQEVEIWFRVATDPPPTQLSAPSGSGDFLNALERTYNLLVELSLLEYFLTLIINEGDAGKSITYGILNCLVQSVERCRATYIQALILQEINVENTLVLGHGVFSHETVDLTSIRNNLDDVLISLKNIITQVEMSNNFLQKKPIKDDVQCNGKTLKEILEGFLDLLKNAGVDLK